MAIQWNDFLAMAPHTLLVLGGLGVLVGQMVLPARRVRFAWNLTFMTLVIALIVVTFGLSDIKGTTTVLPRAFFGTDAVSAIGNSFKYSAFSANVILLFLVLALCTMLFMRHLMPAANLDFAENYFLLLMSVAGYSYAICAEDFITLFVALELGSLPILVLVGLNRKDAAANEAALKYMLLSAFAIAFLLLGIALLYAANATVKLRELKEIGPHFLKTRVVTLAYILIFTGFFFKIAAFPLHSYVADVYEGSSTLFTAILASLSKVASVLLLLKISMGIHDGYRHYLAPILSFAAIGSMLFGAFASMATSNLKRILAYSSITHAGYMLCFFIVPASTDLGLMGTLKQDAGSALYIYAAGYALATLLAFGMIAVLENSAGKAITLDSLGELARHNRPAAWAISIAVLSFMGMPPLAGFMGKFFLFKYLALSNNLPLAAVAGLASGISVYAYIRILKPLLFSDDETVVAAERSLSTRSDAIKFAAVFLLATVTFFAIFSGFLYNTGITAIHKIY